MTNAGARWYAVRVLYNTGPMNGLGLWTDDTVFCRRRKTDNKVIVLRTMPREDVRFWTPEQCNERLELRKPAENSVQLELLYARLLAQQHLPRERPDGDHRYDIEHKKETKI
jgi:hypothetical protein